MLFRSLVPATTRLDINAFSAPVTVINVSSSQHIEGFSGSVTIEATEWSDANDLDIKTFSGSVRLRLPAQARGTIDFNNPTRIDPFFDIETETRVRVPQQTYRVTIRAVGTLYRFTPEFTSNPALPEVDVLGLLFSDAAPGRDVEVRQYSTVTPQEQLLRQRATRALTGALSAEVGRVVEQAIGVDTFQLTPSLVDPNAQS